MPKTYKVEVVVTSKDDDPNVEMEVKWDPTLSEEDLEEMGYVPAAYNFIDTALVTAAYMAQEGGISEEDLADDRTIN